MSSNEIAASRMNNVPFSGIRDVFEECDRLEAAGRDVVHLEIGRPDFDTPNEIKAKGVEAIENGYVHYTSNYGIGPLREQIARKFEEENDLNYDSDSEVIVTTGATEAVFISVLALVEPNQEVLIPDPGWTYEPSVRMAEAIPVTYELDPESGFQPNVESLSAAVSDQTQLLIVNSPQNPTGSVIDRSHAEQIRDIAVENDLLVLSDEIYEKIRYDGHAHYSLASLDEMYQRTITVNGFSKAYSMTGWRLGYLGAPSKLVNPLIRARQYTSTCAPSISQYAGTRALMSDLHEPMVEAFARRRDRVIERLKEIPGMKCPTPAGAFYAFPTLPDGYEDERAFASALLQEAAVALVPGTVFGDVGRGHLRIAYSNSVERIDTAFDRIEDWL